MPYHHFTPNEQYVIAHMTIAGFSQREIGRRLGRHHTNIGREIRRNRPTYADDAGIAEVILPADNLRETDSLPAYILKSVKLSPVENIDQVIERTLMPTSHG